MRMIFAAGLLMLTSSCANWTTPGTGTETIDAFCTAWGEKLPSRSRQDTQQTQDEIQQAYAAFLAQCPAYSGLIP